MSMRREARLVRTPKGVGFWVAYLRDSLTARISGDLEGLGQGDNVGSNAAERKDEPCPLHLLRYRDGRHVGAHDPDPTMSVVSAPAINPSQMAVIGPVTIQSI